MIERDMYCKVKLDFHGVPQGIAQEYIQYYVDKIRTCMPPLSKYIGIYLVSN